MSIPTWKPVVVGLILAAGVYAYKGHMICLPGINGLMLCGMSMSPNTPQYSAPTVPNTLKINATMFSAAKTGDNAVDIAITDAAGKPITAAKVTTEVAMTSMDMGTNYPSVKEIGEGHYTTTVAFSMAGPWRVTVTVMVPKQKPQVKSFDFSVN